MFMWIILGALCFGAVFDGLGAVKRSKYFFWSTTWDLSPWTVLILMQLSFIMLGMFLDDTAMLVIVAPLYIPLVRCARLRSRLVRHPLHDHLPDRVHHAALRLQPLPDARDGAARDHPYDIYRSIVPFVFLMMLTLVIIG
jgi:TRAP-type C4-dicarboxylate transport system permease large subunit